MNPYFERRQALLRAMQAKGGGLCIITTSLEYVRNGDNVFPFRPDSYFYYLSGFKEPEAAIVLIAGESNQSILFCRPKNEEREIWDGLRYGPQAAKDHFGFDEAYPIESLKDKLPLLLKNLPTLFYAPHYHPHLDTLVNQSIQVLKGQSRSGVMPPAQIMDIHFLLNEMRLIKDETEIMLMQKAADIAAIAHQRAMKKASQVQYEYELEAELLYAFRQHGAQSPSYSPIVAGGKHACILHYNDNNQPLRQGDLVLIDAGCEYEGYASDITRTFPLNGVFSGAQRDLYELVLRAQLAAIDAAQVGTRYHSMHDVAVRILTQGMLDLRLLDQNKVGGVDDAIASGAYRLFYMHGTGHWLGLDVHDVGNYRDHAHPGPTETAPHRFLKAGMVITIEPGIYVRPHPGVPEAFWDIGIRIEDDILITEKGPHNLSAAAPKSVVDIESLMRFDTP